GTAVADRHEPAALQRAQVSDDVRAPVAVPNDADVYDSGSARHGRHAEIPVAGRGRRRNAPHRHAHLEGSDPWSIQRSNLDGVPAAMAPAATSRVTTLPAPTIARSPIVTRARIVAPEPIDAPAFTVVVSTCQSSAV